MKNNLFYCTLKVQTFQKLRLLNTLAKAKITVFDLKSESNEITFTLKIKDLHKTFAILKNMCYNYCVCSKHTLKTRLLALLKRSGFVLSFLCSLVLTSICSNVVVGIRVQSEDIALKEQIVAVYRNFASYPKFVSNVDLNGIKESIRNLPSVAECSVKVKGNYLEVAVLSSPKEEERNPTYSSYVACYDATITEIIAHKGTPQVKVGQRVFKGTSLISPQAFNENGEEIINTGIFGKVFGEVVLAKTLYVTKTQTVKVKSGNKKEYTSLAFSKLVPSSPYKLFKSEVKTQVFNIFLPVYYTKTTYEELVEREVEINVEEFAKTALEEFAMEKAVVGEKQSYKISEENGLYKISLYIKAITEIGVGE